MKRKFTYDHDLHIHSLLSSCSRDAEQTPQSILNYAKRNGLKTVALTDHYWDGAVPGASDWYAPQNFEHISKAKPLPTDPDIRFLFGCETDLDKHLTLGIPKERFNDFDFIIIPTTHLHMTDFTIQKNDAASLDARARLWVERLDAILSMELPFQKIGLAHLACHLIAPSSREDYLSVLEMIPTCEMERLFKKAATLGIGIELNANDMSFADEEADTVLRMFRIAKRMGCKFYLASDAHHPAHFEALDQTFARAIDLLELFEEDKIPFLTKSY